MIKNSTFIYLVNDFENISEQVINIDDYTSGFEDILGLLDEVKIEPRKEVIDNIIKFAKA